MPATHPNVYATQRNVYATRVGSTVKIRGRVRVAAQLFGEVQLTTTETMSEIEPGEPVPDHPDGSPSATGAYRPPQSNADAKPHRSRWRIGLAAAAIGGCVAAAGIYLTRRDPMDVIDFSQMRRARPIRDDWDNRTSSKPNSNPSSSNPSSSNPSSSNPSGTADDTAELKLPELE